MDTSLKILNFDIIHLVTDIDANTVKSMLESIFEYYETTKGDIGTVELYKSVAVQLSRIVQQEPPWSWRYPQGVRKGTLLPSKQFAQAVLALGAVIDGLPVAVANTVAVTVYARPGTVKENSIVMGESRPCAYPGCRVWFVPNVPWRVHCPDHSKPKKRVA